ncbi:hypothetical protein [Propionivibrio sp.]|uniref:hypothetical protein n=1 Tax=Propionivibrio sp. TaxID=2212460 RepID=UPI002616FD98|nr:hypothetical protein [Propionivibrio sp.]
MSNLELSQQAELSFANLKNIFHRSKFIDGDLELQLECEHIVIGIQQVERYETDVSFYIGLREEKISFTFRDMAYALVDDPSLAIPKNLEEMPVRNRNNIEVEKFIQFCITYKDKLQEWPPTWFSKASNHSIKELSMHFEGIAETTRLEHQEIMQKWVTGKKGV